MRDGHAHGAQSLSLVEETQGVVYMLVGVVVPGLAVRAGIDNSAFAGAAGAEEREHLQAAFTAPICTAFCSEVHAWAR